MTTLVLGLDGASFELLRPWMDQGALSNLSAMAEQGVDSDMQSCLPPVTCPNWQCYATGTNPGKLGVFWWEAVDRNKNEIRNTSASGEFEGTHYWTLFDESVAVVNLPTTYPPPEIDGVHVAGGPGSEQTEYANPPEVERELTERFDYQVHPEQMGLLSSEDTENACIDEILELIKMRFDAAEMLLDEGEYELLHLTVFYINVLQHFYWDDEPVKAAWELIDRRVGSLVERPDVETVFVMSDHGSNEIKNSFRVNAWLEQEGYLVRQRGVSDIFHTLGLTRERVRPLLARTGLEWWLRRLVPERVQQMLPDSEGSVDKTAKSDVIDWNESVAVASGQGPVYVLAETASERRRVAAEIAEKLRGHTTPSGELLVSDVLFGDEVYEGKYVDRGPDLLLRQASGVHIEGRIGSQSPYGKPDKWRGENKETGLFIAHGDGISQRSGVDEMSILDIAPTLLHMHGYAVPKLMDGTVRKELYAAGTDPASRSIVRTDMRQKSSSSPEPTAEGAVSDRLEDLGYLE